MKEVDFEKVIADIPTITAKIPVGIEPKYKCKNKFLQKILTKLFGEKIIYEEKQVKKFIMKAEDYYNIDNDDDFCLHFYEEKEEIT